MASRPSGCTRVDEYRREEVTDEPIRTQTRSVQRYGRGLYLNIPELSTDVLNIRKGDELEVESHGDRVVIKPKSD